MIVMIRNQKTQIATNTILRSLEYGHLEVCRKNFQEEGKLVQVSQVNGTVPKKIALTSDVSCNLMISTVYLHY